MPVRRLVIGLSDIGLEEQILNIIDEGTEAWRAFTATAVLLLRNRIKINF